MQYDEQERPTRDDLQSSRNGDNEKQVLARDDTQRLVPLNWPSVSSRPVPKRAQVVIIGSGLAGLAAAQRLHASGFEHVLVLEAQKRLGGRVHTIGHSEYLLELGAQWLHGAHENPLYSWLTELEMLDDFQDGSLGFAGNFYTNAGLQIEPKLVERFLEVANAGKFALFKGETSTSKGRCRSLRLQPQDRFLSKSASELFAEQLHQALQQDHELMRANKEHLGALLQWFLRYETIENGCDSMEEVSPASYTDWSDLGEGTLLNFRRGYSSLLAWFCAHFPADQWLHLNKQVLNVELVGSGNGADNKILIHYRSSEPADEGDHSNGTRTKTSAPHETIECEHVIVTASLGFLKQNLANFFRPPLPEVKQQLIKSLGFGTVNKIVLQFSEPFWQTAGIKLVWTTSGQQDEWLRHLRAPWARDIVSFDVVRRQPNLLIGWIGGQGAKQMELESEERVGQVCLALLERFLPKQHARPSRLIGCLCSRWQANEFTRGSYSFRSMSSLHLDIDRLHEPIYAPARRVPLIMFAGEATAGKLYSTTHGAILSGWREAERLRDFVASRNEAKQSQVGQCNGTLKSEKCVHLRA